MTGTVDNLNFTLIGGLRWHCTVVYAIMNGVMKVKISKFIDYTLSGSALQHLIHKPSEFVAILAASIGICRMEKKQNSFDRI